MSELIDRQALKAYVNSLSTHPLNEWDTWGVLAAINKQPTIDAVPVVRCGECRRFVVNTWECQRLCDRFGDEYSDARVCPDWFCADGEREVQE